jgi:hypothetical protein
VLVVHHGEAFPHHEFGLVQRRGRDCSSIAVRCASRPHPPRRRRRDDVCALCGEKPRRGGSEESEDASDGVLGAVRCVACTPFIAKRVCGSLLGAPRASKVRWT